MIRAQLAYNVYHSTWEAPRKASYESSNGIWTNPPAKVFIINYSVLSEMSEHLMKAKRVLWKGLMAGSWIKRLFGAHVKENLITFFPLTLALFIQQPNNLTNKMECINQRHSIEKSIKQKFTHVVVVWVDGCISTDFRKYFASY